MSRYTAAGAIICRGCAKHAIRRGISPCAGLETTREWAGLQRTTESSHGDRPGPVVRPTGRHRRPASHWVRAWPWPVAEKSGNRVATRSAWHPGLQKGRGAAGESPAARVLIIVDTALWGQPE